MITLFGRTGMTERSGTLGRRAKAIRMRKRKRKRVEDGRVQKTRRRS